MSNITEPDPYLTCLERARIKELNREIDLIRTAGEANIEEDRLNTLADREWRNSQEVSSRWGMPIMGNGMELRSTMLGKMSGPYNEIEGIMAGARIRQYTCEFMRTPSPLRPVPFVTDGIHT
jgi:hypothetical protein